MNEKKNINHTSAETVYKLCLYLNCNISDILNNVVFLENGKGVYLGYHYQWKKTDNRIELHITDNNKDMILLTLKTMCQDLYGCYMKQVPEMMIDDETGALRIYKDNGSGLSPFLGNADTRKMKRWWEGRAVPASRNMIKEVLRQASCPNTKMYLAKNLALSMTDSYWIRPLDMDLKMEVAKE